MKTRAWDGERWRTDYVVTPDGKICMMTAGKDFFIDQSINLVQQPDWKLSRFTGLCDMSGKEIYEGDILQKRHFVMWSRDKGEIYETLTCVVEWATSGFILRRIGESSTYIIDMTKYEIIGSIFENPELLMW